jgi:hypothetical protein
LAIVTKSREKIKRLVAIIGRSERARVANRENKSVSRSLTGARLANTVSAGI